MEENQIGILEKKEGGKGKNEQKRAIAGSQGMDKWMYCTERAVSSYRYSSQPQGGGVDTNPA